MKAKIIKYNDEAKSALVSGVKQLAKAVSVTMGPKGRVVAISYKYKSPHVTKDGVTVARQVHLQDPFENVGAQMVREAALKAADTAGDGTTTSTVLAGALVEEGYNLIQQGVNPVELKHALDVTLPEIIRRIELHSSVAQNRGDLYNIAMISSNGDEIISNNVVDAFFKVGKDLGIVRLDDSRNETDSVEHVAGMTMGYGYRSPYFCNDKDNNVARYDNVKVVLIDDEIETLEDASRLAQLLDVLRAPLLIIANGCSDEVLRYFLTLRTQKNFPLVYCEASGFGERRNDEYEDIATLTGAKVLGIETGRTIQDNLGESVGEVDAIEVNRFKTALIDKSNRHLDEIKARLSSLQEQAKQSHNEYVQRRVDERIGRLGGGVATIHVGGTTKIEQKERKDRYDDTLRAVRVASLDGFVPGGGNTLLSVVCDTEDERSLINWMVKNEISEQIAHAICNALTMPYLTILRNAGLNPGDLIEVGYGVDPHIDGYDVRTDSFVNLIEAGIVDPTTVTTTAVKAAISVAGLILTTECVMVDTEDVIGIGSPEL